MSPRSIKKVEFDRVIDAPPSIAFRLWTHAEQLAKWWGPKGFTNPQCEVDPVPGGKIFISMTSPDGTKFPLEGIVTEVEEPSKFSFKGMAMPEGNGTFGLESTTTVTLEPMNEDQTKMHVAAELTKASPAAKASANGMEQGWSETLDRFQQAAKGASIA